MQHPHIAISDKFTTNDCANLLQHSLNKCSNILRPSKHGLNTEEFKFWSESYYQSLLLLCSGKDRLNAYKLKMLSIPQIMDAGFVRSPRHHMCEAMEKSNHHAHKDFRTKTMRSKGKMYHLDPLFYEGFVSYCHYLDIVSKQKRIPVSDTFDMLQKQFEQTTTYSEICKNVVSQACKDRNRCHSRFKTAAEWTSFSRGRAFYWNDWKSCGGYNYSFFFGGGVTE